MKIQLQQGEQIIKEGAANHFLNHEGVGGRQFLTNQRLFFSSHDFNIQTHNLSVPLSDIKSVEKTRTYNIIPNGMEVELSNGNIRQFVVWGRGKWVKAIAHVIK